MRVARHTLRVCLLYGRASGCGLRRFGASVFRFFLAFGFGASDSALRCLGDLVFRCLGVLRWSLRFSGRALMFRCHGVQMLFSCDASRLQRCCGCGVV